MPEPLIPQDDYLELVDADALADALPDLAAYKAATDDAKTAALLQATIDIDSAMPYQGRKYDVDQHRQFPRARTAADPAEPAQVWDWDDAEDEAVVPAGVKRAALYQADAILAGERVTRLDSQHDGVVYTQSEDAAESYKSAPGAGVPTGLCRQAWIILRRYRLQGGKMI